MNNIEGPLAVDKKSRETAPRTIAIAANLLHGASQTPESLGKFIVGQESKAKKPIKNSEIKNMAGSKIETMNRADLIKLSEKIDIDGTSLRQIFETKLVGENGLRRLIKEYINGDDLSKALRYEVIEHNKDFERDPAMRDLGSFPVSANASANPHDDESEPTTNLESFIKKAESSLPTTDHEEDYLKAKEQFERAQKASHKRQLRSIDVIFVAIFVILLILIIILIASRS